MANDAYDNAQTDKEMLQRFENKWYVDQQDHGTFLMFGNYCVAKLDNFEDPEVLYKAINELPLDVTQALRSFPALMNRASESLAKLRFDNDRLRDECGVAHIAAKNASEDFTVVAAQCAKFRTANAELLAALRAIDDQGWENMIKPAGRRPAIAAYCFPRELIVSVRAAIAQHDAWRCRGCGTEDRRSHARDCGWYAGCDEDKLVRVPR